MQQFLAAHPETARAMQRVNREPPTSGFADSTFRGLNAFYFVNSDGQRTPVCWSLAPLRPVEPPPASPTGRNLFNKVIRDVRSGRARWRMLITVGEPEDEVRDATVAWPPQRRVVEVGTVVLDTIATEASGNAREVNFDAGRFRTDRSDG